MGRHEILVDENLLIKLFEKYLAEHPYTNRIRISEITKYCTDEFNNGNFPKNLKREFWGRNNRQGGILLEQINSELASKHTKKFEYPIISTQSIIDNCKSINDNDKKFLNNNLIINEKGLQKVSNKLETLNKQHISLQKENAALKCKIDIYEKKIKAYESILFQWADISSHKDIPLLNRITLGKNKNDLVTQLFTDILNENPIRGFESINTHNNDKDLESNIIPMSASKKLLEDLDLLD